ncbi:MAG: DUF4349 domain-containing protein [Myxococcota bacterium]|jgi:hypothetical protein|nr:DUF4349 domain-containing protein [Myxococcota bacterium]
MGKRLCILLTVLGLAGCGASYKSESAYDGTPAEAPSYGGMPGEPAPAPMEEASASGGGFKEAKADYNDAPPAPPAPGVQPAQTSEPEKRSTKTQESPMVVYTAHMRLRVKRLLEAIEAITGLAKERGGYIESMSQELVVVRVPAKDFDETVQRFSSLGSLLWKRVQAQDVTAAFTDLQRRADVARWARQRLLALLERERDVNERLRILAEIKRQTELIESIEAQLETYRNLVDYFTLFIELEPVVADVATVEHRSPFAWIRALRAHEATIHKGGRKVSMKLPKGFVLFDRDKGYIARAADTTILRAARVDNEPKGDGEFWGKALDFEMDGRDEERLEASSTGPLVYRVYRDKELQPRLNLVAVLAKGDDLWVVEVFFPTEAAWQAHGGAVKQALTTFEVK